MQVKVSGSGIKEVNEHKKKQVQIIKQSFPLMCSKSLSFRHVINIKTGDSLCSWCHLWNLTHISHLCTSQFRGWNFPGNPWPAAPPWLSEHHLPEAWLGASSPLVMLPTEAAGYLCPHLGQHLPNHVPGASCSWLCERVILKSLLESDFLGSVCAKSLQSCPTLWDPMGCSPPCSSVHGILQVRIREWVAMPSSRGSSPPRDLTHVSYISCIGRWVLYH